MLEWDIVDSNISDGLRARYGMDWKTRRKMFRVIISYLYRYQYEQIKILEGPNDNPSQFFCESTQLLNNYIEYGISHIDSYAFVNAFCIARENLGREGENMTKKSFSYRYMLLEQARHWARRCMQSGYIQKNRQGFLPRARSYVNSLQYVFICLFFSELDTIPARESERKYHKACEKTGGMRKDVTMDCKCLS